MCGHYLGSPTALDRDPAAGGGGTRWMALSFLDVVQFQFILLNGQWQFKVPEVPGSPGYGKYYYIGSAKEANGNAGPFYGYCSTDIS